MQYIRTRVSWSRKINSKKVIEEEFRRALVSSGDMASYQVFYHRSNGTRRHSLGADSLVWHTVRVQSAACVTTCFMPWPSCHGIQDSTTRRRQAFSAVALTPRLHDQASDRARRDDEIRPDRSAMVVHPGEALPYAYRVSTI